MKRYTIPQLAKETKYTENQLRSWRANRWLLPVAYSTNDPNAPQKLQYFLVEDAYKAERIALDSKLTKKEKLLNAKNSKKSELLPRSLTDTSEFTGYPIALLRSWYKAGWLISDAMGGESNEIELFTPKALEKAEYKSREAFREGVQKLSVGDGDFESNNNAPLLPSNAREISKQMMKERYG